MRCFISVEMPDEIRKELLRVQENLPSAEMKHVELKNMHLTLAFLGELTDFEVDRIKDVLKSVKQERFIARLGRIGVFPSENYIRVVWISLEPSEKLKELNEKVISSIKPIIKADERFESHVTLARVKAIKDKQEFISKLKEIEVKPLEFEIKSFSLIKSTLTGKGPVYEEIRIFPLGT